MAKPRLAHAEAIELWELLDELMESRCADQILEKVDLSDARIKSLKSKLRRI